MADQYTARGRLHHGGVKDGVNQEVWYEDGDEIDVDLFTEKDLADALQVGAIVPKAVYDALQKADEARVQAEQAQVEAEARLAELQHISRTGGNEITALSDTEVTDKERVDEVTDRLVERTKAATVRQPAAAAETSEAQSEQSTSGAKAATVRSKETQSTDATKK